MLSSTAEYALRTVLEIARQAPGDMIQVETLAERLGIPRNYLSKVLHRLAREQLLLSTRGKGGGFQLARSADRISLFDVVEPFDGVSTERRCLLGQAQCSDRHPCEAHVYWKGVSEKIAAFIRETTVADLAARPRPAPFTRANAGERPAVGRPPRRARARAKPGHG